MWRFAFRAVVCTVGLTACAAADDGQSPLVDLANRLFLAGDWTWTDSVLYRGYVPAGDSVPHHGLFVLTGTATIAEVDSATSEQYVLDAVAELFHLDSTATEETARWTVPTIEYADTVDVRSDTIFGLTVEPIPPEAGANTARIRWVLSADQLWCTNWLRDSMPAGNADDCSTVIHWVRTGAGT